jgi:hypothetical protein
LRISIILFCLLIGLNSCEKRTEIEEYRITITSQQGMVLFEKEGQLDYYLDVKTFNGEAFANIYVRDLKNINIIYRVSGVGIQVEKEYLGLKPIN